MSSLINIQVTFDKLYQFSLLRENLSWQQLATVIQSSIPEAAGKESLSLYYSSLSNESNNNNSSSKILTLSSQGEFSRLLNSNKEILGLRLYGQSQDNIDPVYILPSSNDAFKKLSEFVHRHHLESNLHLSKMVGILAARIVYSPNKNFEADLTLLENSVKHHSSSMNKDEVRKMMKARKVSKKQHRRQNSFKKTVPPHHHKPQGGSSSLLNHDKQDRSDNISDNNETIELLSHHTKKNGYRRERHGRHSSLRHCGDKLNVNVDLISDNSSETENNEHVKDKYDGNDSNSYSSSESESEPEREESFRFGRRDDCHRYGGHERRHHHHHRLGFTERLRRFDGEIHHHRGCHSPRGSGFGGRRVHVFRGFIGPSLGRVNISKFGGECGFSSRGEDRTKDRRGEEPRDVDFEFSAHPFGTRDHHDGKRHSKHSGKFFVFI